MTRTEYVNKLKDIVENYKTLYVLGCFGAPMTDYGKQRYTNNQAYNCKPVATVIPNHTGDRKNIIVMQPTKEGKIRREMIMNADENTFGFDCVCLFKGVLSGWCGDNTKKYGGAKYPFECPDMSANGLIQLCKDVSTDFSNIEIGECVWMEGHVGYYVGDGKVIECTPKWDNCVQYSNLGNIGNRTGNYRIWTKHGKIPYLDYNDGNVSRETFKPSIETSAKVGNRTYVVQKGDTLTKIANRFDTTIDKIVADNIKSHKSMTANHIVTGWKLTV